MDKTALEALVRQVLLERLGASGRTSNQHLSFDLRITNPALTAQVLVAAARAAARMPRPRLVCTGRSYGPVFPAPPL